METGEKCSLPQITYLFLTAGEELTNIHKQVNKKQGTQKQKKKKKLTFSLMKSGVCFT